MKIAIVRLSAMGDLIQSATVLQFIKRSFPHSHITWFCDLVFSDILKTCVYIDKVVALDLKAIKKELSFFKIKNEINKISGEFDYIIDLQGLIKSAIVGRIAGKNCYGFDKNSLREPIASLLYKKTFSIDYSQNVITRYTSLVENIFDIKISANDLLNKKDIFLPNIYAVNKVKKYLNSEKKNCAFVLGASWQSKIYPIENFIKVANELKDFNKILIWGNEKEFLLANKFKENIDDCIIIEKLDLSSLVALIKKCDLVIGNDTGPTHIAWAVNTPSITIYGPTPSFRNSYLTSKNLVVDTGKIVDPKKLNKDDFSISNIEPKQILKCIEEIFA